MKEQIEQLKAQLQEGCPVTVADLDRLLELLKVAPSSGGGPGEER